MPHDVSMPHEPKLHTPDHLRPVLSALSALEPLIYAANAGARRDHFERLLAPGFWEVGASGQRYSRDHVLATLHVRQQQPFEQAWQASDHHVAQVAPGLYLYTYTLVQPTRTSRRATLWQEASGGWQMVYHQGTVVQP